MEVEIKALSGDEIRLIPLEEWLSHINSLVDEDALILADEPKMPEEEEAFVEALAREVDKGEKIVVGLFESGKLRGLCFASRGKGRERYVVDFGIAISTPRLRGKGYGYRMLKMAMELSKAFWDVKKFTISYIEGNEPARKLYEKLGFKEVCKLKHHVWYKGKMVSKVVMEKLP